MTRYLGREGCRLQMWLPQWLVRSDLQLRGSRVAGKWLILGGWYLPAEPGNRAHSPFLKGSW